MCNKAFNQKYSLELHQKSHIDDSPFQCDQCNKNLIEESLIFTQKHIHKSVNPFQSSHCI